MALHAMLYQYYCSGEGRFRCNNLYIQAYYSTKTISSIVLVNYARMLFLRELCIGRDVLHPCAESSIPKQVDSSIATSHVGCKLVLGDCTIRQRQQNPALKDLHQPMPSRISQDQGCGPP